jgi:tetratricopeptide (TPR) repeat protein
MQSDRPLLWPAVSVICCGLGMGTKEAMVTAPVLVLLYDRAFFAGSFIEALRRRWGMYGGLAATWVILAALLWSGPRQEQSSGFTIGGSLSYATNQGIVILRYLRLSVWPRGQCLDYSWPIVKDWGKLALPVLAVLCILAVTVWGLVRNKSWSYPAAWFFGTLAVTSSFVPVKDLIFEHRMYLPLAGLTILAVAGGYVLFERRSARKLGVILAAAVIVVLGLVTFRRNDDYRSAASIWQTVCDAAPDNSRAYNNLGMAYGRSGQYDKSIAASLKAIRLEPGFAKAYYNLGLTWAAMEHYQEAIEAFREACRLKPDYAEAYNNLGVVY